MRIPLLLLVGGLLLATGPALAAPPSDHAQQRARAERAVKALATADPELVVRWEPHRTRPTLIRGLDLAVTGETALERARTFLRRHPELFAGAQSTLDPVESRAARDVTVLRFQQRYRGVPVDGATVTVALRRGRVDAVQSEVEPLRLASVTPRLDARQALNRAMAEVSRTLRRSPARPLPGGLRPTLRIIPGSPALLVYRVVLPLTHDPLGRAHLVDARSGAYLGSRPAMIREAHGPGRAAGQEVRR